MPVWVYKAKNRYQPKYERSVVKYNVVVSHTGHVVFVSGGHPGAMSDTTLARKYSPALRESDIILADLAYVSIPHCLTPIKICTEDLLLINLNLTECSNFIVLGLNIVLAG